MGATRCGIALRSFAPCGGPPGLPCYTLEPTLTRRGLIPMALIEKPIVANEKPVVANETFFGALQYASNYFRRSLSQGTPLVGADVLQAERKDDLRSISGDLERLHVSDDAIFDGGLKVVNLALLK